MSDDLVADARDARVVAERVATAGFTVRPINIDYFDHELAALHAISLESFSENVYYSPIDQESFRALYEPLRSRMDPEFVLIALDRAQRPCGFLFAFADPASLRDGRAVRLIAKTVAVSPRARGHGLANHMLDRIRNSARARGICEVIHALMHVSNPSTRMPLRYGGGLFRRYALWEWTP